MVQIAGGLGFALESQFNLVKGLVAIGHAHGFDGHLATDHGIETLVYTLMAPFPRVPTI